MRDSLPLDTPASDDTGPDPQAPDPHSMAHCGSARIGRLLTAAQCRELRSLYGEDRPFRSRVVMARHGFGRGEYKYFAYPLPPLVQSLRETLYRRLVDQARAWSGRDYPPELADFLRECHAAGQRRPTPLLLRYVPGDFNCLHQDLYGALYFPLQVAVLLSCPEREFTGGEMVTRASRNGQHEVRVHALAQGDALVLTTRDWPAPSARGRARTELRHGVSTLRSGERHVLGLVFHDAT